jgi:hypothetical protein
MMLFTKPILFIFIGISCFTYLGRTQADTVWMTTHGGLGLDQWNEVVLCDNGDVVVVGTTSSDLVNGNELYVARLDSVHHCLWTYTLGQFGVETGEDVELDAEGNIWCMGTVNGSNTLAYDVVLFKISANGDLMTMVPIEDEGMQFGQKMAFDQQNLLSISAIEVNTAGGRDLVLYLYDINANNYTKYLYPQSSLNLEITVTEWDVISQQWMVAGNAFATDVMAQVKGWGISNDGSVIWSNVNDENSDSLRVFDAVWKNDAWVMAGSDWIGDNWRAQIVKWIPGQSIQKMGSFALTTGETVFHSVVNRSTGNGFVFGGWTYAMGAGLSDAYIHAFDDNFNWDGGAIFGGSKEDKIFSMVNDQQGLLHWGGVNGSYNASMQWQGWVARLNSGYVQSSNINMITENTSCFALSVDQDIHPSSVMMYWQNGILNCNTWLDEIQVYDITGAMVLKDQRISQTTFAASPGCYIVQWKSGERIGTNKVILY